MYRHVPTVDRNILPKANFSCPKGPNVSICLDSSYELLESWPTFFKSAEIGVDMGLKDREITDLFELIDKEHESKSQI